MTANMIMAGQYQPLSAFVNIAGWVPCNFWPLTSLIDNHNCIQGHGQPIPAMVIPHEPYTRPQLAFVSVLDPYFPA